MKEPNNIINEIIPDQIFSLTYFEEYSCDRIKNVIRRFAEALAHSLGERLQKTLKTRNPS